MSAGSPVHSLPRELVLASAGSGKTYHLSSHLIGLLAAGVPPEAIWASTFTRKAAAEILERVLTRLANGALDARATAELAASAGCQPRGKPLPALLSPEACGRLLGELARSLHRANISTLDSFFIQMATTFAEELGLAPGWRLVDGPAEDRMRVQALEAVLAEGNSATMAELVRMLVKGDSGSWVQGRLLEQVESLLGLHREVDENAGDLWTPIFPGVSLHGSPTPDDIEIRCREMAEALTDVPVPNNKNGSPNANWAKEMPRLALALRSRDWDEFFGFGLGKKLVEGGERIPAGEVVYSRHSPDAVLAALLDEAVALARIELGRGLMRQGRALGRLAGRYREAFETLQAAQGGYRFDDITHFLRRAALPRDLDALYFRLDARIRHVLLDEFQDTSLPQWEVLEPLVSEIVAEGGEEGRAAVVVADPKQSIYGWRGARPGLVRRIKESRALADERLPKSYRSGPVLLGAVSRVFEELEDNPVVGELAGGSEVARRWCEDFFEQEASDPGKPGFVRLITGPEKAGGSSVQPDILDHSAELVGELGREAPGASIGVLVRTNKAVSFLISALRRKGIRASGEGGTPLTDTAPVNGLMALLQMADHPGDRLARYHVAQTPVGDLFGYGSHHGGAEAKRLARKIRGFLMRDGYGKTLDEWARDLGPDCDGLERARLGQLVELGFRWDRERTLRPGDFVRWVESQRVEDPSGARIRVMTVHQSKGLEFDVVVLPQLYASMGGKGTTDSVVPVREGGTGRLKRVYPAADNTARALFPELRKAWEEDQAHRIRDELSGLYVAMTRARYALHLVVPADGERGQGKAKSAARILREALAPEVDAGEVGKVLFQDGDPGWFARIEAMEREIGVEPKELLEAPPDRHSSVSLRPVSGARTRNLARRSPSSMEGGSKVDLAEFLNLDLSGRARLRGTLIHAWCEEIEWIEDGLPGEEDLLRIAGSKAMDLREERLDEWLADFRRWMKEPAILQALSRARYPSGARVEQELPFVHRVSDGILQGYVDRLVTWAEEGRVVGAEVLDFKTDYLDGSDPDAVEAKVEYYRPQIDAYREAVAARYQLGLGDVGGTLLFLRPGMVQSL